MTTISLIESWHSTLYCMGHATFYWTSLSNGRLIQRLFTSQDEPVDEHFRSDALNSLWFYTDTSTVIILTGAFLDRSLSDVVDRSFSLVFSLFSSYAFSRSSLVGTFILTLSRMWQLRISAVYSRRLKFSTTDLISFLRNITSRFLGNYYLLSLILWLFPSLFLSTLTIVNHKLLHRTSI